LKREGYDLTTLYNNSNWNYRPFCFFLIYHTCNE
jgi:hypothetical protein